MGNATQPAAPNVIYRFGLFVLDPASGALTRNGIRVRLQDQPFRLLTLLVQRPGEIVSREEIQHSLWPANTFVEFDKSLGVAVLKVREALADDAANPRFIQTIPRRGYRFIAPVSVENPTDAAGGGMPTQEALGMSAIPGGKQPRGAADGSAGHAWYWIVPLILATAVVGFGIYKFQLRRDASPANSAPGKLHVRRSVAVIGFRNLPGQPEDNWLSAAFADMLNTELAADGTVRMVSGEDVARAKRDLPLTDEDSLANDTLERLRKNPGADVVVLGSYTLLAEKGEKRIRLDVRLQDTASGETIAEKAFVGDEDHLFELVSQAGAALRKSLGSAPLSGEINAQARAALPSSPLAVRLYTEGKVRLWTFDYIHARDLLIQAIAVEPDFPLAHASLSEAWNHLGYNLKARDEIEHARSLAGRLGPEERLLIDGQYYSALQDRNKAIEVYRKLFAHFPDNLSYGLRLADEQRWVNPEEALQTLSALRHLPAPTGDDPRIDLIEARAWINRDSAKAEAAGRRAVEKGLAQGSHLLVARAYGILCQTGSGEGSGDQTLQDCENARETYAAVGDRNNEARTLNDVAAFYYQQGNLNRAETMFRQAITVFREAGDVEGLTTASSNLGDISLVRGNLAAASRALSDAIPGYREMGDKDGVALALNDLGEVARLRGNLAAALTTYESAKATAHEIDDKRALGYVLYGIGDVLLDRGDLEGAANSYQESLSLRKQIGDKQTVAETELALARLAVEKKQAADAESLIRRCKEQFHQEQEADDELSASIMLVNAFLTESKFSEAETELKQAKSMAARSTNTLLQLQSDLASARVAGASGQFAAGITQLTETLQSARSHGLMATEFETRLAMAELRKKAQQLVAAQAESLALERAARKNGFLLIASKAVSLRGGQE
jgi:eukaryotic-like serine/threonine-protein kinase